MKFTPKQFKKFQQGGPIEQAAPAPEEQMVEQEAPAAGPQEDPMAMLAQGAMQALQTQDCQIAMQVCQGLLQLLQQAMGQAPEEPQGEPVFRKGGVLSRRIRK